MPNTKPSSSLADFPQKKRFELWLSYLKQRLWLANFYCFISKLSADWPPSVRDVTHLRWRLLIGGLLFSPGVRSGSVKTKRGCFSSAVALWIYNAIWDPFYSCCWPQGHLRVRDFIAFIFLQEGFILWQSDQDFVLKIPSCINFASFLIAAFACVCTISTWFGNFFARSISLLLFRSFCILSCCCPLNHWDVDRFGNNVLSNCQNLPLYWGKFG